MKKIISLLTIISLFTICLTGCDKVKDEGIVGKWVYNDNYIYTFDVNGTGTYYIQGLETTFIYEIKGDKLLILYTLDDEPFETDFKITKNKLYIKDVFGNDTVYTRK